jgi:hypothetical protein
MASPKLACPKCGEADFAERASFKAATEALMGAPSVGVVVDLMSCKRCGFDLPTVRGRKHYVLVEDGKLANLQSQLEEEKNRNSATHKQIEELGRRATRMEAEIERTRVRGEVSAMEERVAVLESETRAMEERKAKLGELVDLMASWIPQQAR